MNFLKRLFSSKNSAKDSDKKTQPSESESFYTPLEKIIPVFFEGKIDKRPFFNELVNIPLIMPTINEEGTKPLVITKGEEPLVVYTTAKERLEKLSAAFPEVKSSVEVSLAHYMSTISEPVAIVINPGWKFEVTIAKESVTELMKSISMEFCNLDIMVSRYFSNQISMSELVSAIKQYSFGIVLREEDTDHMADHMALLERADEEYSCIFSSEYFAQEFREEYPEFPYSANAKGEGLLDLLPQNAGIILNPASDYEIVINRVTLYGSSKNS